MASYKDNAIIEKLNASNYATWSFKLEMLLIKEDLFDAITETPPEPITSDWSKKDKKAKAMINLFISDDQIVHVKGLSTSKETWVKLKNLHERTNLSSKLYLLKNLYSCKLAEGGNMIKHITNILEIKEKLTAIGENINDSHLSALLLCSLPPSYDPLITALEAKSEEDLTPSYIQSKLMDEYNRRSSNNKALQVDDNAVAYQIKRHKQNFPKKQVNKFCTYCKMKNHNTNDCWYRKDKNKKQNYSSSGYNNKNKNFNSSLCFENSEPKMKHDRDESNASDDETHTRNKLKNLAFIACKENKNNWIVDSGSSSHITNNKNLFSEIKNYDNSNVVIANGNILTSQGSGDVVITTETSEGEINKIKLLDVLFVPDLETNLISVSKATKNGCTLIFKNDKCILQKFGKTFLEGELKGNLYEVKQPQNSSNEHINLTHECNNKNCITLWHKRLGHRNYADIKHIMDKELAVGININFCKHDKTCETCIKEKLTDLPYPQQSKYRTNRVLELIHTDICGPFQTPTIGGKTYFLTFIDDYTRFCMIYLLKHRSEVLTMLKQYIALVKNKFGKLPERVRSDNGREYVGSEIENYLNQMGIKHELTVPYCPAQNGVAERKNRTLVEMVRSMLSEANLDKQFWGEAVNTANYIINRLPTKGNNKSPYELWNGIKPNLSHLRVFGCKAFAYINKQIRRKLDNKAQEGIFVGYDYRSKGYRIYTGGKGIIIARTVKFIENQNSKLSSQEKPENDISQKETVNVELNDTPENNTEQTLEINNEPRRSSRSNIGVPPDRLIYMVKHDPIHEPQSWAEVQNLTNPVEKNNWIKAAEDEISSLKEHNTWTLVDPPQGKKIIGSKWTFKTKYDDSGKIQKFKARLVAQGFLQKFGEDYDETFAPVVSYTTIRSFLNSAAYHKLNVRHIDIKTAFLHGDLNEELYMQQPDGFINPGEENKVCRLNKSIYGLKQAARAWYLKIGSFLKTLNYVESKADSCLYVNNTSDNISFIIVYVDDILIAGNNGQINEIIRKLSKEFEVKDLGEVSFYLGMKITRNDRGDFEINQKLKIEELVRKLNLEISKPTYTPMETNYLKFDDNDNPLENNTKYRQTIGSLLYLATVSRPDILAAVNILSRRNESPRKKDWETVKRVVRYLNTTKNLNFVISANEKPKLVVYADADWGGDKSNRKSTSGSVFMIGDNPIQWITKRQNCVALSSAEAEFISATTAAKEIMWILKLLKDLHLPQELPIKVFQDNISCIKLIDIGFTGKLKHVDLQFNYLKDLKEKGVIEPEYCPSDKMTGDIFTKALPRQIHEKHREKLKLISGT